MVNHSLIPPGKPGIPARWTSSAKSGIGKALNSLSQVSFTISHGIINEVYFPREDVACTRDMELIVTDGKDFFSEEKRDTKHFTETMGDGIPAYKITNECLQKKYKIIKEIITDCYGRVDQSISALAAHRSVHESLPSHGSCYSVNL